MDLPDRLPGDQLAVLELVLRQGRGYAEIARLLSIDPAEVRTRAHAALDQLGPQTTADADARGRIADYLLGQLPANEADELPRTLAQLPAQRAWAQAVSAELAPLAAESLPPIPDTDDSAARAPVDEAGPDRADGSQADAPRSSRTGGIVLLSIAAAAIIVAIVIFVVRPGGHGDGGSRDRASVGTNAAAVGSHPQRHPAASNSAAASKSGSPSAKVAGEIALKPPAGGKPKGIALVLDQGSLKGLGIEATQMPPTSAKQHSAYAVWLYNSPTDATRLGFVSKGVSKTGTLGASAELPSNAAHYKFVIVTLETGRHAKPGPVVLEGSLSKVPRSKL